MTSQGAKVINVIQGDFAISDDPEEILTTVLGSCIAVCLYDTVRAIGGMNHFLLPGGEGGSGAQVRYGTYAMEMLIDNLLKRGALKKNLEAKVFGGASMMGNLRDIGTENAQFAHEFLASEDIPLISESTGGTCARRIRFWPGSGRVRQMLVDGSSVTHNAPQPPPDLPEEPGDMCSFE